MSEERLQEIKDSIELQYKVQEANDLHSFNIFTDEEQELVEEVERLHSIIKEVREYIEENLLKDDNGCGCWWYGFGDYNEAKYELLEILDKVEEE